MGQGLRGAGPLPRARVAGPAARSLGGRPAGGRPELSYDEAQAAIHAVLALIQSPLRHRSARPRPVMRDILLRMALAGLHEARA